MVKWNQWCDCNGQLFHGSPIFLTDHGNGSMSFSVTSGLLMHFGWLGTAIYHYLLLDFIPPLVYTSRNLTEQIRNHRARLHSSQNPKPADIDAEHWSLSSKIEASK